MEIGCRHLADVLTQNERVGLLTSVTQLVIQSWGCDILEWFLIDVAERNGAFLRLAGTL